MFDNLKKIAELKKIQDTFKKEKIETEKRGVRVVINGNLEFEEIKLNPELNIEDQQTALKECINEAKEAMQKKMAQTLMGAGLGF